MEISIAMKYIITKFQSIFNLYIDPGQLVKSSSKMFGMVQ